MTCFSLWKAEPYAWRTKTDRDEINNDIYAYDTRRDCCDA